MSVNGVNKKAIINVDDIKFQDVDISSPTPSQNNQSLFGGNNNVKIVQHSDLIVETPESYDDFSEQETLEKTAGLRKKPIGKTGKAKNTLKRLLVDILIIYALFFIFWIVFGLFIGIVYPVVRKWSAWVDNGAKDSFKATKPQKITLVFATYAISLLSTAATVAVCVFIIATRRAWNAFRARIIFWKGCMLIIIISSGNRSSNWCICVRFFTRNLLCFFILRIFHYEKVF